MSVPLRALLVARHAILREALADLVRRVDPDAEVWSAGSLEDARTALGTRARVRLVLIADGAPDHATVAALSACRDLMPGAALALVAPVGATAAQALAAGADALIPDTLSPDAVARALRFVLEGNRFVAPEFLSAAAAPPAWTREVVEDLPVAIELVRGTSYLYANRAARELSGFTLDELRRVRFGDLLREEDREQLRERVQSWQRGQAAPGRLVVEMATREGGWRRLELLARLVQVDGQPALAIVSVDVTDRPDAAAAPGAAERSEPSLSVARGLEGRNVHLTSRQLEILGFIAAGMPNKVIAHQLNIREATVKLHVHAILRALRVPNRTAAALLARDLGVDRAA